MATQIEEIAHALNTGNVEKIDAWIQSQIDEIANGGCAEMWETSPRTAALLAYIQVQLAAREQQEAGLYAGEIAPYLEDATDEDITATVQQ